MNIPLSTPTGFDFNSLAIYVQRRSDCQVEKLVGSILHAFGGPDAFASSWMDEIANAKETKPGSLKLLNAYRAIARLVDVASATVESGLADLSDDELADLLGQRVEDLIADRPEIVVAAAEAMGYVIVRYPEWVCSK